MSNDNKMSPDVRNAYRELARENRKTYMSTDRNLRRQFAVNVIGAVNEHADLTNPVDIKDKMSEGFKILACEKTRLETSQNAPTSNNPIKRQMGRFAEYIDYHKGTNQNLALTLSGQS